ncbi:UNVERIFIED_CONTAM: hypothetical protein GTU68_003024 [Idotea baltica]|nr:hypothetical protein [Idotea baltica]
MPTTFNPARRRVGSDMITPNSLLLTKAYHLVLRLK